MTITRRFQACAETGSNYEWTRDDDSSSVQTAVAFAFTGNRGARQTGSFRLGVGTSYSKFRAGFFFLLDGYIEAATQNGDYIYPLRFESGSGNIFAVALHYFSGEIGWRDVTANQFDHKVDAHKIGMFDNMVFHHIGVFCDNGNSLSVYIDGNLLMTVASIPTFVKMEIGGANSGSVFEEWHADDFYLDELTDEVDHCPPTVRFVPSSPSADGADTAWTASRGGTRWQEIDEVPIDLGDYLYVDAADLKNTVEGTDIVFNETLYDFDAVVVNGVLIAEAGLPEIRMIVRDGAGIYGNGADQIADYADYALYQERFTEQPDTTAWNIADFNGSQFGLESRGDYLL